MQRRDAGRGSIRMRANQRGAEPITRAGRPGAPYPSRAQASADVRRRSTRRRGSSCVPLFDRCVSINPPKSIFRCLDSTNSHFRGSRDVSISGGQFNNTLGHHTNLTINLNRMPYFPLSDGIRKMTLSQSLILLTLHRIPNHFQPRCVNLQIPKQALTC